LGLAGYRFHDLRHTHACYLFSHGWTLKDVQERLGHKDPTVTLKVYLHFISGRQAQLIEESVRKASLSPVLSTDSEAKKEQRA